MTDDLSKLAPNDHRRLGAELELFTIDPLVGAGLPLWLPKGATVRRVLERFITDEELRAGYQHVVSPHLGREALYRASGHYPYYKESMYPLMTVENEQYVLRPMTCPHHIRIYSCKPHSYRELPLRLAEFGDMYRYERSGVLMGLTRVRGMTLNDAHIFCREAQVQDEVHGVLNLIQRVYETLGLTDYWVDLALHDPKNKKKYLDNPPYWEKAEAALRAALTHSKIRFQEVRGEAAFYGPKADVQMKDAVGHTFTVSTIQLDMLLPERLDLSYINEEGKPERPVLIHRAVIGTLERFIAFLIEHTKGSFPLWLAPVQVRVLPVSEDVTAYARTVTEELRTADLRAELDDSPETLQKRIRNGETQKIPVLAIVGKKEMAAGTVSLRGHGGRDLGPMPNAQAAAWLRAHVEQKSLRLADGAPESK